jgi:hypothetical protein
VSSVIGRLHIPQDAIEPRLLGSGCTTNCKKLKAVASEAATKASFEADFVKVTDMKAHHGL